jgi:hypothetical protein
LLASHISSENKSSARDLLLMDFESYENIVTSISHRVGRQAHKSTTEPRVSTHWTCISASAAPTSIGERHANICTSKPSYFAEDGNFSTPRITISCDSISHAGRHRIPWLLAPDDQRSPWLEPSVRMYASQMMIVCDELRVPSP